MYYVNLISRCVWACSPSSLRVYIFLRNLKLIVYCGLIGYKLLHTEGRGIFNDSPIFSQFLQSYISFWLHSQFCTAYFTLFSNSITLLISFSILAFPSSSNPTILCVPSLAWSLWQVPPPAICAIYPPLSSTLSMALPSFPSTTTLPWWSPDCIQVFLCQLLCTAVLQ